MWISSVTKLLQLSTLISVNIYRLFTQISATKYFLLSQCKLWTYLEDASRFKMFLIIEKCTLEVWTTGKKLHFTKCWQLFKSQHCCNNLKKSRLEKVDNVRKFKLSRATNYIKGVDMHTILFDKYTILYVSTLLYKDIHLKTPYIQIFIIATKNPNLNHNITVDSLHITNN